MTNTGPAGVLGRFYIKSYDLSHDQLDERSAQGSGEFEHVLLYVRPVASTASPATICQTAGLIDCRVDNLQN